MCVLLPDPLCPITYPRHGQAGTPENNKDISAPVEGDPPSPPFPWMLGGRARFSQTPKMATLKRSHQQAWPEEEGDREHGLYSLHRMFDIVGTHLTHRDVRVLSFLFVDVIDDYERGMIRSGQDFLLALERQGRCDETNFRQVLQLLRIITRHDLLPYVTLKRRKAVCPDLVDKYLEETSIRYVTPRDHSNTEHLPVHQHKSVPPHHPLVCCSSSGPQICAKRSGRGRALLGNQRKRRKSVTPDPKDKQTCGEVPDKHFTRDPLGSTGLPPDPSASSNGLESWRWKGTLGVF
ncbi:death effector domain-containing protein isoform X1 [Thamnophis elegans]|uniref:death effector domain-containing protein isoform X1 n=2 Tax=Thamnophis elegans TaxID=35005 RepID=UPI0013774570|nr:death effector domain-containing protein isoform X1 [Thamnophis elegans]